MDECANGYRRSALTALSAYDTKLDRTPDRQGSAEELRRAVEETRTLNAKEVE